MAEVYKIVTEDGQEFIWHGGAGDLRAAHPGAEITARLLPDEIRGGTWESFTTRRALAAEKKAAEPEPEKKAAESEPKTTTTTGAPKEAIVVNIADATAKKEAK